MRLRIQPLGDNLTSNFNPETDDCIRLVQSLLRHRYYGRNPDSAVSDAIESSQNKNGV